MCRSRLSPLQLSPRLSPRLNLCSDWVNCVRGLRGLRDCSFCNRGRRRGAASSALSPFFLVPLVPLVLSLSFQRVMRGLRRGLRQGLSALLCVRWRRRCDWVFRPTLAPEQQKADPHDPITARNQAKHTNTHISLAFPASVPRSNPVLRREWAQIHMKGDRK